MSSARAVLFYYRYFREGSLLALDKTENPCSLNSCDVAPALILIDRNRSLICHCPLSLETQILGTVATYMCFAMPFRRLPSEPNAGPVPI